MNKLQIMLILENDTTKTCMFIIDGFQNALPQYIDVDMIDTSYLDDDLLVIADGTNKTFIDINKIVTIKTSSVKNSTTADIFKSGVDFL